MRRATLIVPPGLAKMAASDELVAKTIADSEEVWRNDEYVVTVRRRDDGTVGSLSIRRADRRGARDWRDFQRIKNEIAGDEAEAVELYPAKSRTVDSANQYWLWCFPPGMRLPLGMDGRQVSDDTDGFPGAVQRPGTEGI
jgi:hypothetical protein